MKRVVLGFIVTLVAIVVIGSTFGVAYVNESNVLNKDKQVISYLNQKLSKDNQTISTLNNSINGSNNKTLALAKIISDLQTELSNKNNTLDNLSVEFDSLVNVSNYLKEIVLLNNSAVLTYKYYGFEPYNASFKYAGFIGIKVTNATSSNNTASVNWNAYGIHYSNLTHISINQTVYFPVLPNNDTEILLEDYSAPLANLLNATITYYY